MQIIPLSTRKVLSKSVFRATIIGVLSLGAVACATSPGGNVYSARDAGVPSRIKTGTLIQIDPITIQGDNQGIGAASGAVIGGAAGSQVGGGDVENAIGAVAGAVIGGVVGNAAERNARTQSGYRYTIDVDGEITTIVQADPAPIAPVGSRVRLEYGARVKVLPAY